MGIRDMLKNIFPLPARKQRQEFATIKARLKEQQALISKKEYEIKLLLEALDKSHKQQKEFFEKEITQMRRRLQRIDDNTIPKVLWSKELERNLVKLNWGDVTKQGDFAEKFIKLTKGMDPNSIQAVIRILIGLKAYLNSDKEALDLFTRSEQEKIRWLKENFYSKILKLSDNLFAYKNYLLPINGFQPSVFYYKHGLAEVETADSVAGKSIIDVGGFIGDSVLIFEELHPEKIYTFEALPDNFNLLQQTLKLNDIKNVVAENIALGAEKGKCTLHIGGSCTTAADRPGINYSGDMDVPVITLDEYVAENKIENIGLIKVDIEGAEPDFLVGAKSTICAQKPILLLSIYHNAHDFFELKPLIESWNLGYRFKIHKPAFGSVTEETLLIAEIV